MFALSLALCQIGAAAISPRSTVPLLQLQRDRRSNPPPGGLPVFGLPVDKFGAVTMPDFYVNGFCKRFDGEPACTEKPCCCWSTYGNEKHPAYPSPSEVLGQQDCLNPPDGFDYAPDPGLTFDDGYKRALELQGQPQYVNRRLCCLHRSNGARYESQRDLHTAVEPAATTVTTTVARMMVAIDPTPGPWTTVTTTTARLLNPGEEYGTNDVNPNARLEEAARRHLAAANDLSSAAAALNASASAIEDITTKLKTDPSLVRRQKRIAGIKSAIRGWAERRWTYLNRLSKESSPSAIAVGLMPPPGHIYL